MNKWKIETRDFYKTLLIEGAAESPGTTYNNKQTDSFAKYYIFSLVVLKNRMSDEYSEIGEKGSKAA